MGKAALSRLRQLSLHIEQSRMEHCSPASLLEAAGSLLEQPSRPSFGPPSASEPQPGTPSFQNPCLPSREVFEGSCVSRLLDETWKRVSGTIAEQSTALSQAEKNSYFARVPVLLCLASLTLMRQC